MPEEHFPPNHHRAMLDMVENPGSAAPEPAWQSLCKDVIALAAQNYYLWGKKGRLWESQEDAHSFFLEAILLPRLTWEIEQKEPGPSRDKISKFLKIPFIEIKLGHLPFETWRLDITASPPARMLTDEQIRAEYIALRMKWEKWINDHPLRKAWEKRESGGDARLYLVRVTAHQAVRDRLNPLSPREELRTKLRKTLGDKDKEWFCDMGDDWFTLATDEAKRWLRDELFSGVEYATKISFGTSTKRHARFPEMLPSRDQIRRRLYFQVFLQVKTQLHFDQLLDLVQAVYRVPKDSSPLQQLDEPIGEEGGMTVASKFSDPHTPIPGDKEWPEAAARVAAELLLLLHTSTIAKPKTDSSQPQPEVVEKKMEVHLKPLSLTEIETMMRRMGNDDPNLLKELCPSGRRVNGRVLHYFLHVWLWLERDTNDGKVFTHARYQSDTGIDTSTFSDRRRQAEPVISLVVLSLSKNSGWPAIRIGLRFLAQYFSTLKPESVYLGHLNNGDEIVFDPLPDETGDEPDTEEA